MLPGLPSGLSVFTVVAAVGKESQEPRQGSSGPKPWVTWSLAPGLQEPGECPILAPKPPSSHRARSPHSLKPGHFTECLAEYMAEACDELETIDNATHQSTTLTPSLWSRKKEPKATSGIKQTKQKGKKEKQQLPDKNKFAGLLDSEAQCICVQANYRDTPQNGPNDQCLCLHSYLAHLVPDQDPGGRFRPIGSTNPLMIIILLTPLIMALFPFGPMAAHLNFFNIKMLVLRLAPQTSVFGSAFAQGSGPHLSTFSPAPDAHVFSHTFPPATGARPLAFSQCPNTSVAFLPSPVTTFLGASTQATPFELSRPVANTLLAPLKL
ncbi:hypothetical protein DFH07DRAFT_775052 [Mycena maculata]|uniref:Uncharacterized protein n=1 Tax=Mycena maculata TaxID=230809 RepID=A0AAD7IUG0_9AGAR|nr:hypothetical protein DFH07DRAFT_775052 [Mycena maculata]